MENNEISKAKQEELKEKEILEQVQLYLEGKSLRDIAKIYGVSHYTIRHNFLVKLKRFNCALYENVLAKIEDNSPDDLRKEKVARRVLESYKLFVENDKTILEIRDILNEHLPQDQIISEFTVYRDLTVRLPNLHAISPETVTEEMLNSVKTRLTNNSLSNLNKSNRQNKPKKEIAYTPEDRGKLLFQMYPTKEKRIHFLERLIITFGLKLDSISEVFALDAEDVRLGLEQYGQYQKSLFLLLPHEFIPRGYAIETFEAFFNQLVEAWLSKDKEKLNELARVLSDADALTFRKTHKPGDKISDADIAAIVNYQIKYGLASKQTARFFGIRYQTYVARAKKYIANKPAYETAFNAITDFYFPSYRRK